VTARERRAFVVARSDDIPVGGHVVVEAAGRQFGVFNVDGRFYALPNACFHQNGPLCRGKVGSTLTADAESGWQPRWSQIGQVVECPWHRLEFNIVTGQCLAFPRRKLPVYEVRVDDGAVVLFV
jgi:nitrite reductase (NADH) small subunit